jgi:hypothetical protein
MRLSPHTAQASVKVSHVGIPANIKFTSRYRMIAKIAIGMQSAPSHKSGRHLLSLLSFDSITFRVTGDPLNVSPLAESHTRRDILAITARHSLLSASYSSPPTACLAVSLPKGRWDRISTFLIVDPLDDLGAPSTPVALQFRTSS